jgi:small-conductance mechanosensitive channel
MRTADLLILGTTFFSRNEHPLTALLTLVLTGVLAFGADRWLGRLAGRRQLRAEIDTRLAFLRRLVVLGIILFGLLFALSQFGGLNKLAATLLASTAIVAAIVGFAARQTLANLVAGVMLIITQPLRIGDEVSLTDYSGTVEDVRLNYTVLVDGDGRRLFVPNELLAAAVLRNDTIVDPSTRPEVSLWLAPAGDPARALDVLTQADPKWTVRVAEVTPDGTRLAIRGEPLVGDRSAVESSIRTRGLQSLQQAGLIG